MKVPFIVFEGADGVGKTTHSQRLVDWLRANGHDAIHLHEPTNGVWGQRIRSAARNGTRPDDPMEEVRWFTEDRREDVSLNIRPALEKGTVVVLDRYFYSTAAYQGARGVSMATILQQNRQFAPEPDLCVFLHCDVIEARRRITGERGDTPDAFEGLEYQRRVSAMFRQIVANGVPGPHLVLPTNRPHDEVAAEILAAVRPLLNQKETNDARHDTPIPDDGRAGTQHRPPEGRAETGRGGSPEGAERAPRRYPRVAAPALPRRPWHRH